MDKPQKTVIVVDPFYQHLIDALHNAGLGIITVNSDYDLKDDLKAYLQIDESKYLFSYNITDGIAGLQEKIKPYTIVGVINGCDSGTKTSLEIGNALGLDNINPICCAEYLRNKYKTMAQLEKRQVPAGKHLLLSHDNRDTVLAKAIATIDFPMVVKPTASAGSYGVNFCDDKQALYDAVDSLLDQPDLWGNIVKEVMIEERHQGKEMAVLMVSLNDQHTVSGVLSYVQSVVAGKSVVTGVELEDNNNPEVQQCIDYAREVLNALDFHSGQAAVELYLTAKGPRLIEVNPRVAGVKGLFDELTRQCTGRSQVDLTALSYTEPEKFLSYCDKPYSIQRHGRIIFTQNHKAGNINKLTGLVEMDKLPSCHLHKHSWQPGDTMPYTDEFMTSASFLLLVNDDPKQLEKDTLQVHAIEHAGLFD